MDFMYGNRDCCAINKYIFVNSLHFITCSGSLAPILALSHTKCLTLFIALCFNCMFRNQSLIYNRFVYEEYICYLYTLFCLLFCRARFFSWIFKRTTACTQIEWAASSEYTHLDCWLWFSMKIIPCKEKIVYIVMEPIAPQHTA